MIRGTLIFLFALLLAISINNFPMRADGNGPQVLARIGNVGPAPDDLAITPNGEQLFITNTPQLQNGVEPLYSINTETFQVQVDNSRPTGVGGMSKIVIHSQGDIGYVVNSTGLINPFNITANMSIVDIGFNAASVSAAALTHDGKSLYVTENNKRRVMVFELETLKQFVINRTGKGGSAIVLNKDDSRAYTANNISGNVAVIDTVANKLIKIIPGVGVGPRGLSLSPDGKKLYVANNLSNDITVIDIATDTIVTKIADVGKGPWAVAFAPDGKRAYVTNNLSNDIAIINTANNRLIGKIVNVGAGPRAIVFAPDGKRFFVANHDSRDIAVISLN